MTKLNARSSWSAFALQASIHVRHRSQSNRNIQLLEICVSSWKQGSSSNSNRNKNALFAILPTSILLALCGLLAACAGTSSAPATAPVITAQPANAAVTAGQPAIFTVAAVGTAPLSYQWTKNGMNVGTNSATYTTAATASSDNGAKIQVMVSNSKESPASSIATLTVDAAPTKPTITTQPANATVTVGQTATFTVAATGTAPLTYQWAKNGTNVGTNSATYTTAATALADNGAKIQVTVSNAEGSAPSSIATLTVNVAATKPSITTQPANVTVAVGQTATFTVVANGTAPLTYQWTKGGMNVGTNSATYTTAATTSADNGAQVQVTVSNSAGSTPSSVATLTVNAAATKPSITTQPANVTVTVGQTATFTVVATGTAPLTYQWTKGGMNVGTNSATYTTAATTSADNGAQIQVTVSNSAGSTPSSIATLTVNAA